MNDAALGCFIFVAFASTLALVSMFFPTLFGCMVFLIFPMALIMVWPYLVACSKYPWDC